MLLWCEGFDHYGLTETFLTEGLWSEVGGGQWTLLTTQPRTGTHSIRHSNSNAGGLRRQLGAAKVTAGVGFGLWCTGLPVANNENTLVAFRDAANAVQVSICLQTTGAVSVSRGIAGAAILGTSSVLVTAGAWNHFEVKILMSQTVGTVEVRLNGVTILSLTGQDTCATALVETSQVVFGTVTSPTGGGGGVAYFDDIFAWDTAGSQNNDFMGDWKAYLILPDADTADADWVPSAGSGFGTIDDASPDDDTTYVEASVAGDMSQYGLQDLPSEVVAIAGVYAMGRTRKTDAGTCDVTQSMVSNAVVAAGTSRPLTTAYTFRPDVFELDPNTSAAWTPTAFNAANIRYTRTA